MDTIQNGSSGYVREDSRYGKYPSVAAPVYTRIPVWCTVVSSNSSESSAAKIGLRKKFSKVHNYIVMNLQAHVTRHKGNDSTIQSYQLSSTRSLMRYCSPFFSSSSVPFDAAKSNLAFTSVGTADFVAAMVQQLPVELAGKISLPERGCPSRSTSLKTAAQQTCWLSRLHVPVGNITVIVIRDS